MIDKDKSLFVISISGLIGFLYPLYQFLIRINDWSIFITPPGMGEVVFCIICGLISICAALGVDIKQIIPQFDSNKVSDVKIQELNK